MQYKMPPGIAVKPPRQKKTLAMGTVASGQQLRITGGRLIEW